MTTDETNKIITSFSRALILVQRLRRVLCPQVFPQSDLEYPKEEIAIALTSALNYAYLNKDHQTAQMLNTVITELDSFIDDEEAYNETHKALGRREYWELLRKQN